MKRNSSTAWRLVVAFPLNCKKQIFTSLHSYCIQHTCELIQCNTSHLNFWLVWHFFLCSQWWGGYSKDVSYSAFASFWYKVLKKSPTGAITSRNLKKNKWVHLSTVPASQNIVSENGGVLYVPFKNFSRSSEWLVNLTNARGYTLETCLECIKSNKTCKQSILV